MGRQTGGLLVAVVAIGIVALLAGQMAGISSTGAAVERRQIPAGGTVPLSATISNPLDVPDVLTVSFSGPAVRDGTVDIELPADSSTFACNERQDTCRIRVPAGGDVDLEVGLTGGEPGRAPMRVTVASTTTAKEAEARMFLIVTGETVPKAFADMLNGIF